MGNANAKRTAKLVKRARRMPCKSSHKVLAVSKLKRGEARGVYNSGAHAMVHQRLHEVRSTAPCGNMEEPVPA